MFIMDHVYKRVLRIARTIVLALLALLLSGLLGGALYLKSDKGQQWLTGQVHQLLTNQLETNVSLDSASFDLPRSINLYGLTICDHRNNTLLTTKALEVQFTIYSFDLQSLVLSGIHLKDPHFYGRKYPNDTAFNYDYIIENTKSDKPKPDNEKIFRVLLDDIQLSNGLFQHYNYARQPMAPSAEQIDFNRLKLKNLNLKASYLQFIRGRISADINQISFKEASGFQLDSFQTAFTFDDQTLDFQNLLIKTPRSRIADQVTMNFDDRSELGDFLEKVKLITNFQASRLALKDLRYFTDGVAAIDEVFHFSGQLRGTVADFQSRNFRVAFGQQTFFKGEVSFNGLPDFNQTFIKLNCQSSYLRIADFRQVFPDMNLPLNLGRIQNARFQGNFTGFPTDFVAYGQFQTPIGLIKTDLNLKRPGDLKAASYSGNLTLKDFDLGHLVGESADLGEVTMKGEVVGEGLALEHLAMKVDAGIESLAYNDYTYNQIAVKGAFSDERFEGNLGVSDPQLGLDFKGSIDFSKTKPDFDFKADLRHADLYKLNFVKDTMLVDSRIDLDFQASNPDNAEGLVKLSQTNVQLSNRKLSFDSLKLRSTIKEQPGQFDFRKLTLASDILDLNLAGTYQLTTLDDVAKMTLARLVDPSLIPGDTIQPVEEELNFALHVHNAAFLMELAKTPLVLQDDTRVSGYVNTGTKDLTLEATIPGFYYNDWSGRGVQVKGSGSPEQLSVKGQVAQLKRGDSAVLNNSWVSAEKAIDDSLRIKTRLKQGGKILNLNTAMHMQPSLFRAHIYDSDLQLYDTTWQVKAKPVTYRLDSTISVPQLSFTNGKQRLTATGQIGGNTAKPLRILFDGVRLGTFTKDLFPQFGAFQGTLDGQVLLKALKTNPNVRGGLMVSALRMNADTMGNMRLSATYQPEQKQVNLSANVTKRNLDPVMDVKGYIRLAGQKQVYLKAQFQETRLSLLEGFAKGFVSDLDGTFHSELLVQGPLSRPKVEGYLDLNQAALTIDYLQTRYRLDDRIAFDEKAIRLKNIQLKDVRDKTANVNGAINHNYFDSLTADITLEADNFKALNTEAADNDVFYGKAYASGFANFTGPLNNINMDMTLRSEEGTVINIPASEDSDYEGYDFIHYVDDQRYFNEEFEVSTGGMNLNLELDVTTDALVRIIFNPETQDILKGRGTGNLQLNLTRAGTFEMYGNYTIQDGNYLFTAFDVIRKRFELKQGGTINWSGDPLDAKMDIQAAYQVKTSTAPLLPPDAGSGDQASQEEVPVEAQLFLTGSIFSPNIDLDFEIMEAGNTGSRNVSALNSQIQRIKNNEQALNQQVVSLLVMNRFIRSSGFQASDAIGAGSNSLVGDLISNQLTYWVRQFSDEIKYLEDVQLGIDYQGRTTAQNGEVNQRQMEVALSTSLFDDRVSISGSMDMQSASGDVEVSYKLTEDGRVQVKVFSRTNNNQVLNRNTQQHGTGIIWQKSFDTWREFFGKEPRKNKSQPNPDNAPKPDSANEKSPPTSKKPRESQGDFPNDGPLRPLKGNRPNSPYQPNRPK